MHTLLNIIEHPFLLLFITISLGYLVGKIRYKTFILGGISGSLIVGIIIGQLGVSIPSSIGSIFFALFIYAVGYQGGAQFFKSINRQMLVQLLSATITCLLGLASVLAFAWIYKLDRGTAAGLAAGGLTQSAMIGSASAAINQLGLSSHLTHVMQANIAVGYSVCYIFGSFGPILLLATLFPLIMRWDLRKEAIKLANVESCGSPSLEPGQFQAIANINTRTYQVAADSIAIGKTAGQLFANQTKPVSIEKIIRNGKMLATTVNSKIKAEDIVAVTAKTDDLSKLGELIGPEVVKPDELALIKEQRQCILSKRAYHGLTLDQLYRKLQAKHKFGVFVHTVRRFGDTLPVSNNLVLHRGDELEILGRPKNLDAVTNEVGKSLSAEPLTDFIIFGIGMALGVLLGMIGFKIFGVDIHLSAGVGCLLSGLIFGWLRSVKPAYGALPSGASNFLRDFGLAAFVASVGITAGPQAVIAIKTHGLELFFMGIGVTLIPQILSFFISYYVLRIKNPITLLSTIAGGRSANPGFAALLEKAGNATPVLPFTASYALANIWLTLWGPIIVALVNLNH